MSENNLTFERLRRLAESALESQRGGDQRNADIEFKEILHELQVYQIELEIQNEELRQAQDELAASRREFSDLFEHAPVAYFTLDADGIIIKANTTAAQKFRCPRSQLQGMAFVHLISSDAQDTFYFHRRKLLKSRQAQTEELAFVRPDGSRFYGQLESVLVDSLGDNNTSRVAIMDVTQRKTYEHRLWALRELDQAILVSHSTEEIVYMALDYVLDLTRCEYAGFVNCYTADAGTVEFVVKNNEPRTARAYRFPFEAFAAFRGMPDDEYQITTELPDLQDAVPSHLRAHLLVPVYQGQRQVGGVAIGFETSNSFSPDIIRTVQDIALRMGVALQQAELYAQIQQQASNLEAEVQERTAELRLSERKEHEQRTFAEAMLEIVQQLNRSLDLDTVLEHILTSLERVIAFDNASIILVDTKTQMIIKTANRYQSESETTTAQQLTVDNFPVYQQMIRTHTPVFIPDVNASTDWVSVSGHENIRSYIGVPIIVDGNVLGFLNVDKHEQGYLHEEQFKHLHAFAAHAAIAITNARTHEHQQQHAVLEERQRLARELHDAVSQNLFSISIMVQAFSTQLEKSPHQVDNLRDRFRQVEKVAHGAQAEMRLLLLELRPANMEETRLDELLHQLITGLRGRKNIDVHSDIVPTPVLPFEYKLMLYRMAQETLNNISKHADADHVAIRLSIDRGKLILVIEDDGRGFNLDDHHLGHGLAILHERASKIGAALTIDSVIDHGTTVRIVVDLPE